MNIFELALPATSSVWNAYAWANTLTQFWCHHDLLHFITNGTCSKLIQQAIEVFETGLAQHYSQRERARSMYYLSLALRKTGDKSVLERADQLERMADETRRSILGPDYFPPESEETYDIFVNPWSRWESKQIFIWHINYSQWQLCLLILLYDSFKLRPHLR